MGLVWGGLFPLGGILITLLDSLVHDAAAKHRVVQLSSLVLLTIAGGCGFYLCKGHQFTSFRKPIEGLLMIDHYFGTAILAMTAIQAGLGWHHHRRYMLDKPSKRRWYTYAHVWLGRVTILSGITNSGFGLLLAQVKLKWAVFWWLGFSLLTTIYVCVRLMIRLSQNRRIRDISHQNSVKA